MRSGYVVVSGYGFYFSSFSFFFNTVYERNERKKEEFLMNEIRMISFVHTEKSLIFISFLPLKTKPEGVETLFNCDLYAHIKLLTNDPATHARKRKSEEL